MEIVRFEEILNDLFRLPKLEIIHVFNFERHAYRFILHNKTVNLRRSFVVVDLD